MKTKSLALMLLVLLISLLPILPNVNIALAASSGPSLVVNDSSARYWDTAAVTPHKLYQLKANATLVPGETITADNTAKNIYLVRVGYFHSPILKVEPHTWSSKPLFVDETFHVNVTLSSLSEDWHAIGVQFSLRYNSTMIEPINATEGPFYQSFIGSSEQFTIFASAVKEDYVIAMVFLTPKNNGNYPRWPKGGGTVVTITFKVIYRVPRGTIVSSNLTLFDPILLDHGTVELPITMISGITEILGTNIGDLNYDGKVDIKDIATIAKNYGWIRDP